MQPRLVLVIVLGILGVVGLFVVSALLPPAFLAIALMVVVLVAFLVVGLLWRGE